GLIRPADWGVMAVPAGIVPTPPVIGKRAAAAAHRQRDPIRCDGVAERRPDLAARMHGRNRLHGHLHDVGYFHRPALPLDGIADWHLLDAELGCDQRGKSRHWSALSAGEDGAKRGGLPI